MTTDVVEEKVCVACDRSKPIASFTRSDGSVVAECFRCRVSTIAVGVSSDFPTQTKKAGRPKEANSYNAGIPTDARGMPWLNADLSPVHQRQFDRERHRIEEFERARRQPGGLEALRKVN